MGSNIISVKRGLAWRELQKIILIVALVVFGYRLFYIGEKVVATERGLYYLRQERWLEAEHWLQNAKSFDLFWYRRGAVREGLLEVRWITDNEMQMRNVLQQVRFDVSSNDFDGFRSVIEEYKGMNFQGLVSWKREYLLKKIPLDKEVEKGMKSFYSEAIRVLQNPLQYTDSNQSKGLWAKEILNFLPQEYYPKGVLKDAFMSRLLKSYDLKVIQYWEQKGIQEGNIEGLLVTSIALRSTDQKVGFLGEWVLAENVDFLYAQLTDLEKEKKDELVVKWISQYAQYDSQGLQLDKIEQFSAAYIEKKEKLAKQYMEKQQYSKAMELYELLIPISSEAENINALNSIWNYHEPLRMFTTISKEESLITQGTQNYGVDQYCAGYDPEAQKVELLLIQGNQNHYIKTAYYFALPEGIKYQKITVEKDCLVLTGEKGDGRTPILMLTLYGGNLVAGYEGEVKAYGWSKDGKVLSLSGVKGQEEFDWYDYELLQGVWTLKGPKATSVSLAHPEVFMNFDKSELLTFEGYITKNTEGQGQSIAMYMENSVLNGSKAVVLQGDFDFKEGQYVIYGYCIGSMEIYQPETGENVVIPLIQVKQCKLIS